VYQNATRELFGVGNGSENKACFWIISPLKASKWSQTTFCILSMSCLASLKDFAPFYGNCEEELPEKLVGQLSVNFEQINIFSATGAFLLP